MGRPFVITNPDETKQSAMMIDARVQNAIQTYIGKPMPQLSENSSADPLSSGE